MNRIQEAVSNEGWQKFRLYLKGMPTRDKLAELHDYYETTLHNHNLDNTWVGDDCDVCIRVDNYIKALCRGGQLLPGVNILHIIQRVPSQGAERWNGLIKE